MPANEPRSVEVRLLNILQSHVTTPHVVSAARGLSHFGEHSVGWLALSAVGIALDPVRRNDWMTAGVAAVAAHGASIVVKRTVRRRRPDDVSVVVRVSTPGRLSFPSSHASSSTAASIIIGSMTCRLLPWVIVPTMALSRLVLGVHYPSDVVAGTALGAATARLVVRLRDLSIQGELP